jgi:hypothetical protein
MKTVGAYEGRTADHRGTGASGTNAPGNSCPGYSGPQKWDSMLRCAPDQKGGAI